MNEDKWKLSIKSQLSWLLVYDDEQVWRTIVKVFIKTRETHSNWSTKFTKSLQKIPKNHVKFYKTYSIPFILLNNLVKLQSLKFQINHGKISSIENLCRTSSHGKRRDDRLIIFTFYSTYSEWYWVRGALWFVYERI